MADEYGKYENHKYLLRRDAVSVSQIVFFVVAAAAPLTAIVGVTPAAFAFGNGAGVPGTFLLVGFLYLLFSVGYSAMARFVVGAGGFYPYIRAGLGDRAGASSAYIALVTYNAISIAVYGLFGYFAQQMVATAGGPIINWWVYASALSLLVFLCGARSIDFSGRLLGACMLAEILIILVLGISILLGGGPEGITAVGVAPAAMVTPSLGVALVFVVTAFIGFEATAIFGEEARDAKIAIPRATYIAVTLIAVLYAFATWTISIHYGPSAIAETAKTQADVLYINAIEHYLGAHVRIVVNFLLIVSIFACALSFHNTINRYMLSMARDGLMPKALARTHDRFDSPFAAGIVQSGLALGISAVFALFGQHPYAVVFSWMGTLTSLGILMLQIMVCISVIGFFKGEPRGVGAFQRLVAPAGTLAGLSICLALMVTNLSLVSGTESAVVESFPFLIVAAGLLGAVMSFRQRSNDGHELSARKRPEGAAVGSEL